MIITGGENVSPVEIESCLSLHPGGLGGRGGRPAGRALGQDRRRLHQAPRAGRTRRRSTSSAAPRASRTSSGRAATSSSRRSRNRRSASSCAACSSPANTSRSARHRPARKKELPHDHRSTVGRSALCRSRRLPRRVRRRARARRHRPRPAAVQHRIDAAARSAPDGVRGARRAIRTCASSWCGRSASTSPPAATSRASWRPRPRWCPTSPGTSRAPARCSKPVIAANRGYCFGVGFELSLACDFRIVSETCQYALPEQRLGQIPGSGGSARLQKMVGLARTKDIVMRSRRISAKQALRLGHRHRMRAGRQARGRDRQPGRGAARLFAACPAHGQDACSTTPKMLCFRRRSSSKDIATAGCGNPTTSARASKRSTPSARQSSKEPDFSTTGSDT